jgi:chromosome segregation ATPase
LGEDCLFEGGEMNPFSEVGREINGLQDEIRQIKSSLYQYAENYKLDSIKSDISRLSDRLTNLENEISYVKEQLQKLEPIG